MERQRSSDIDLLTLAIAAVASAAAAYLTSQVWAGGALISAALTPVIVAIVKEALSRPADKLAARRTVEQPAAGATPLSVHRSTGRRWRVAIVSGLAAFALVVAVFTIPELIGGSSVGRGGDSATTFFGGTERKGSGGDRQDRERPAADPTVTPTETPEETATPEPEPEPEETATEAPTPTPTPTAVAPTPTASP